MEGRLGRQVSDIQTIESGVAAHRVEIGIERNPAAARLAQRLNGDSERAIRLFHQKARELLQTGSVSQAQIIRHTDGDRAPVFGVQTSDSSPSRRVRAFFSPENDIPTLLVICKADEDGKAMEILRGMGYERGLRTGRR